MLTSLVHCHGLPILGHFQLAFLMRFDWCQCRRLLDTSRASLKVTLIPWRPSVYRQLRHTDAVLCVSVDWASTRALPLGNIHVFEFKASIFGALHCFLVAI